ncbi:MAG: 2-phospho-L-lactate transferase [Acidimicrobiales bacterium]|nr:2-phospho-L-lactate transferase [Acidimicrobiales bacterium]
MTIAVLCGGVGAARLLRGLVRVVDPAALTAIVNVGDDTEMHGLHISPDIDTIIYTLADAIDPDRGWGLVDETWNAMSQFERLGNPTWFNLGDRDLATHIVRTERLGVGDTLSQVTEHLAASWGLGCRIVPVTDDPLRTTVTVADGEISFQEYFVGRRHAVPVTNVRFDGAEHATPAPDVLPAIANARRVVIAPSNPLVSIDPVLAVPGVREALIERRSDVVAVSPIIGGKALKGPADRMLEELGHEASVVGVARLYAPLAATLVVDEADAGSVAAVEAEGMRCIVTDTIMSNPERSASLGTVVLA